MNEDETLFRTAIARSGEQLLAGSRRRPRGHTESPLGTGRAKNDRSGAAKESCLTVMLASRHHLVSAGDEGRERETEKVTVGVADEVGPSLIFGAVACRQHRASTVRRGRAARPRARDAKAEAARADNDTLDGRRLRTCDRGKSERDGARTEQPREAP